MERHKQKAARRLRRRRAIRSKVRGGADRPRLSVYRSLRHIYAQLIDDEAGRTLASASTLTPDIREQASYGGNVAAAALVGAKIAERALAEGIRMARFDRGGYQYHGRVKALAMAARKGGLEF